MSASSPSPTNPGKTATLTLKVSIGILSLATLGLVVVAAIPLLTGGTADKPAPIHAAEPPAAPPTAEPAQAAPQPTAAETPAEVPADQFARVTGLVDESDKAFRIGDFDLALRSINAANDILPNDPGILLRIGRIQERAGNISQATDIYSQVLGLPNLSPDLRAQTSRKLDLLGGATVSEPADTSSSTVTAAGEGLDMRDEFGLQPGAILGIVDTRLTDDGQGGKKLRIAIKARPGTDIDAALMMVHVFFYENDPSGSTFLTEHPVLTEWISPPIDWSGGDPELLTAVYTPPPGATDDLAGFVVGVYYNGELQDTRADPGPLATNHPLQLYLENVP